MIPTEEETEVYNQIARLWMRLNHKKSYEWQTDCWRKLGEALIGKYIVIDGKLKSVELEKE